MVDRHVNAEKAKELFEKFPELVSLLDSGYLRKYNFSDMLKTTKGETDQLVRELVEAGIVKTSPFGYKMLIKTRKYLEEVGVLD